MENLWHALSGRQLCLMRLWPFKASGAEPKAGSPARQGSIIRTRYPDRQFLGFEYLPIDQVITERGTRLTFSGKGGFEANYILGRDPSRPVTVTNNVSWPIAVSIKGKTIFFKYKDKFNQLARLPRNECQSGAFRSIPHAARRGADDGAEVSPFLTRMGNNDRCTK